MNKDDQNAEESRCTNCYLAGLCLPRALGKDDLLMLDAAISKRKTLYKADAIFHQGTESGCIYAIRSGAVRTYTTAKNGDEQTLGFHLPGDILGLDGLDNKIHSCSGVTLATSTICEIPIKELHMLCIKMPGLQRQLLHVLGEEISKDHTMLLILARCNADQKLAIFFTDLSERFGERGFSTCEFELTMTRSEIANYLGLADETISRLIARFKDKNLIQVQRKSIRIIARDRMIELAEGECSLDEV